MKAELPQWAHSRLFVPKLLVIALSVQPLSKHSLSQIDLRNFGVLNFQTYYAVTSQKEGATGGCTLAIILVIRH